MKIAIVKNEEEFDGFDADDMEYVPGKIVGFVTVDYSAGYIFPGTERERNVSLRRRAVDAWERGEKRIKA